MEIYKDDVIEALATEPNLHFGPFAQVAGHWYEDYSAILVDNPNCSVCAVGSVIRNSGRHLSVADARLLGERITGGAATWEGHTTNNYMSALSMFWEELNWLNGDITIDEARAITIDWIEETFPEDEPLAVI